MLILKIQNYAHQSCIFLTFSRYKKFPRNLNLLRKNNIFIADHANQLSRWSLYTIDFQILKCRTHTRKSEKSPSMGFHFANSVVVSSWKIYWKRFCHFFFDNCEATMIDCLKKGQSLTISRAKIKETKLSMLAKGVLFLQDNATAYKSCIAITFGSRVGIIGTT